MMYLFFVISEGLQCLNIKRNILLRYRMKIKYIIDIKFKTYQIRELSYEFYNYNFFFLYTDPDKVFQNKSWTI